MSIKVLIADDHQLMRAGLTRLLEADPNIEVIGEATTGEESIELTQKLHPDVVLMDVNMPGTNGLEATRRLKRTTAKPRVLILTMHEDVELLQACIREGAAGYIIKRAAEAELIDAVYATMRGIIYVHPTMMQSLMASRLEQSTLIPHDPARSTPGAEALSPREEEILTLIVQGYTNRQVADELTLSVRTVESHRANIMDKLNLRSRVELVRYAMEHKLIKPVDNP